MLHKCRLVHRTIIYVGQRKSWFVVCVITNRRAHGELYACGRYHGIKISLRPGAVKFGCEIVQVFGEEPHLILLFMVRNEMVLAAGLLDAVPQIGTLRQTFCSVIFWQKCPLETERIV